MFSSPGLWTSGGTDTFYQFSTWLLGQAAPVLMMVFAGFIMALLIVVLRKRLFGIHDETVEIDDYEDREDGF